MRAAKAGYPERWTGGARMLSGFGLGAGPCAGPAMQAMLADLALGTSSTIAQSYTSEAGPANAMVSAAQTEWNTYGSPSLTVDGLYGGCTQAAASAASQTTAPTALIPNTDGTFTCESGATYTCTGGSPPNNNTPTTTTSSSSTGLIVLGILAFLGVLGGVGYGIEEHRKSKGIGGPMPVHKAVHHVKRHAGRLARHVRGRARENPAAPEVLYHRGHKVELVQVGRTWGAALPGRQEIFYGRSRRAVVLRAFRHIDRHTARGAMENPLSTDAKIGLTLGGVALAGGAVYYATRPAAAASGTNPSGTADANGWTPVSTSAVPAAIVTQMQTYVTQQQQGGSAGWNPYASGPQQPPVGVTNAYGPVATNPSALSGPWYAMAVNGTTSQFYQHP